MGRKCIICGITSTKHKKISLHAFPKDIIQRDKWLNFCQINKTKVNSNAMICRNHFKEEDFLYRVADNKLILIKNAVPSIVKSDKYRKRLYQEVTDFTNNTSNSTMKLIKEELNVEFEYMDNNKSDNVTSVTTAEDDNNKYVNSIKTEEFEYMDNNKTSDNVTSVTTAEDDNNKYVNSIKTEEFEYMDNNKTSDNVTSVTTAEDDNNKYVNSIKTEEFEYMDNNKTSDNVTSVTTAEDDNNKYVNSIKTEESKYFDNNKTSDDAALIQNMIGNNICPETIEDETSGSTPNLRYVGDITSAHLATPRKAKKALNLAVANIVRQKKKIKALQQSSYRFKKKIKSLKNLVQRLRKQELITENAAEVLVVFLNNF